MLLGVTITTKGDVMDTPNNAENSHYFHIQWQNGVVSDEQIAIASRDIGRRTADGCWCCFALYRGSSVQCTQYIC